MEKVKDFFQLLYRSLRRYVSLGFILAGMFLTVRLYELIISSNFSGYPAGSAVYLLMGLKFDLIMYLRISAVLLIPFLLLAVFSQKVAKYFFVTLALMLVLGDILLLQYFTTARVPLGADLFAYTVEEIRHTVESSGGAGVLPIVFIILYLVYMVRLFVKHVYFKLKAWAVFSVCILMFASFLPVGFLKQNPSFYNSEFSMFVANNKLNFFSTSVSNQYLFGGAVTDQNYVFKTETETNSLNPFVYVDAEYPFLHNETTPDVLGGYFELDSVTPPNIVFIVVESLGKAYSGEGAYLGSFTPFLDSLSANSLYWENCLSTSGRTFQVLPSLLASVPFGEKGFAELGENMPDHLSLLSILKNTAGYNSSFMYGGDSKFDNMSIFLNCSGIDKIVDIHNFGDGYEKLPANQNGFSWGYGDREIFRRFINEKAGIQSAPSVDVMLTLAIHDPFIVPNQEYYNNKFAERLATLDIDEKTKNSNLDYERQFAALMYFDESLQYLFSELKKLPGFNNSIFIITGDHRMPEIPISTQLDRFHVPLVIYSPLLKKAEKFSSVVTHFDVTPSILALLSNNNFAQRPALAAWIGHGLDNSTDFRNVNRYPLMRNKNELLDFIDSENMLSNNVYYKIFPNMYIEPETNNAKQALLKEELDNFIRKNNYACLNNKLIPDSLLKYAVKK